MAATHAANMVHPAVTGCAQGAELFDEDALFLLAFHGIAVERTTRAEVGKGCGQQAAGISGQDNNYSIKELVQGNKHGTSFTGMEIHFFGVVVGLYIAQAMGVRCGIYLDTMHFPCLTVAGDAQGIGTCTRTEDANPFPRLHQACHPQPLFSHAGREKAGGKIQMQGQAVFPVHST